MHLMLFFTGNTKIPYKRQTRYALMAKVLQLKELCGNDLLGLKIVG